MTFDELYNQQKKKYGALRERRKSKMGDGKYIEMIGNQELRREKRKIAGLGKIEEQLRQLDSAIDK